MTKRIHVGGVAIGGGAPVSIQSMLNTKTTDVPACLTQLRATGGGWVPDCPPGHPRRGGSSCLPAHLRRFAAAPGSGYPF